MLRKLKDMLGFTRKLEEAKPDAISAQIQIATERNERASERLRELLLSDHNAKMGRTINDIVGKMQ